MCIDTRHNLHKLPVSFTNVHLNQGVFDDCDFTDVKLENCTIKGMTINGDSLEAVMEAYENVNQ